MPCQGGGLDVAILNVAAAPPYVGNHDRRREDDHQQRQDEAEGEEEDVVRNVFRPCPGGGTTHPIALWRVRSYFLIEANIKFN